MELLGTALLQLQHWGREEVRDVSPWGRDPHPLLLQHRLLIVPIPAPQGFLVGWGIHVG